jgi:glycosyltransferase involved in cell wall biosynthesis
MDPGASTPRGESALIIVRNPATHDSRVLREASTLKQLGYRPLILAVTSEAERTRHSIQEGTPILRLSPSSPFTWARHRLRPLRGIEGSAARGWRHEERAPGTRSRGAGRSSWSLRYLAVRLHRWARTIDFYRRAIGVVGNVRPALVHCNDYNTMWIGLVARTMSRAAVVYDAHELWPDRNLRPEPRWWLLAWESLFVRLAHRTITASPGYASVMARRYRIAQPRVIRNIPNIPAHPGRYSEAAGSLRKPAEPSDGSMVAYVGALTRNRGLEVSIRALAQVPEARLRLIGPIHDSYANELAELAQAQGVTNRLEFAAAVPPGRVVEELRAADAGLALIQPVCLSYRMSLPNKLFEYVLAGIPVLGSDLPVVGGFVREHGIGLVASPVDAEDVAAKLREILRPERNREFRLAARKAAEALRWDSESRLLADTYVEAIAVAGRPGHG